MSVILEHWTLDAVSDTVVTVLPDGCRDLIVRQDKGMAPQWFVTDLAMTCNQVPVGAGDRFSGFRLHPGVEVDVDSLLSSLCEEHDEAIVRERLHAKRGILAWHAGDL